MLINWRVLAVIGIAITLAATHWKAYTMGESLVQAEWAADKLSQAEQTARLMADAAAATTSLQANSDKLRKAKNAQITKLGDDLAVALNSLHNRAPRSGSSDLPDAAAAGSSCTGASLFRQDAEFLVRESGRADKLRIDLTECQAAYSFARNALN
jgi:hypothetical protein